jgi:hypothetical protein
MPDTGDSPRPIAKLTQASGLAPAISQDSAATDNLAAIMKNTVVMFESTLTLVRVSPFQELREGTADA